MNNQEVIDRANKEISDLFLKIGVTSKFFPIKEINSNQIQEFIIKEKEPYLFFRTIILEKNEFKVKEAQPLLRHPFTDFQIIVKSYS